PPSSRVSVSFTAPDPPTICTLSLHDALPIYRRQVRPQEGIKKARVMRCRRAPNKQADRSRDRPNALSVCLLRICTQTSVAIFCSDRKSTRLNSSHVSISYAVFCLKKKINKQE